MLVGWVSTAEQACNVANAAGLKNTDVYWFKPPKFTWRPAWFPKDVTFRHIKGIRNCTSYQFKWMDEDGKECSEPGVMHGRTTSNSDQWVIWSLLSSQKWCKACANRFLRPVPAHDDGVDCPSAKRDVNKYRDEMAAHHADSASRAVDAALKKKAPQYRQVQKEKTAARTGRLTAEVEELCPRGEDSEEEEAPVCLNDLVIGGFAIILSGEEAPEAPFGVVKIKGLDFELGTYDVHWHGDVQHRLSGKPERRLVKQGAMMFSNGRGAWVDKGLENKVIVPHFSLTDAGKIPNRVRKILQGHPDCPWDWEDDCCL